MALVEGSSLRDFAPRHESDQRQGILFGSYFPAKILTNDEIASWAVPTASGDLLSADEIERKVGVGRRSIAEERETSFAMGKHATAPLVDQIGREIDCVIFTTSYPTGQHNSTEIARSFHLEADDTVDIHAACSGFASALTYLKDNEGRFADKRVLIVASEKYFPTLPNLKPDEHGKRDEDPSLSQTIFSDGAMSTSFVYGEDLTVLGYKNYLFPPETSSAIRMPIDYNLVREPALVVPVPVSEDGKFRMDGRRVYRAMQQHPAQIMQTVEEVGLKPRDIALIIPHQASLPMLDTIKNHLAEELGHKVLYDLADGNYSSASIPKALRRAHLNGRIKPGDIVVFDGFGAGLFASVVVAQIGKAA